MKKVCLSIALLGVIGFTSCGEKKEAVEATEAEEVVEVSGDTESYAVDSEVSVVNWSGYKIYENETEEEGHNGFIKVSEGSVDVLNGELVGGNFTIDVTTLESVDLNDKPEDKVKLDGHLKSADFLDVEKYPTATFEITEVKKIGDDSDFNTEINGNLKLREDAKNISFKANVAMAEGLVTIKSEDFVINRKDFGVEYSMKGGVLKDNVGMQIDVTATKGAAVQATEEAPATEETATEEEAAPAE